MNQLLIILISQVQEYPWIDIIAMSQGESFDYELEQLLLKGNKEIYLILNTDDLILSAYSKKEIEEEPFISFTLENIKYNLYID